jgi:hypothetical protein
MTASSEPVHLNNHHRDTLLRIFGHPASHNVDWQDVLSLMDAVGDVEERHDGKYAIRVGDETRVVTRHKGKDVDIDVLQELRHLLTDAGYDTVASDLEARGKEV